MQASTDCSSPQTRNMAMLTEDWWTSYALSSINGYGCWCYFLSDSQAMEGR